MRQAISLYYPYCFNKECDTSSYHRNQEVRLPFTDPPFPEIISADAIIYNYFLL
ncbi:MAG TPA: hypothetical protein VGN20_19645 [Mucilaginibacter sp.]|jgi:hypothetical protein